MVIMNGTFYEDLLDSLKGAVSRRLGETGAAVDTEAESWLQQFLKMEMLGRVSAHVAHDFNHVLTVVMGSAEKMLFECGPNNPKRKDLEAISSAAQRASRLVSQILEYTRKQQPEFTSLNLNEVLSSMEGMLGGMIGSHIKLCIQPMPRLKCVQASLGQIEQVIMNLIVNARDAMPCSGGTIYVSTANITQTSPIPHAHGIVPPGAYVRLEVTDTGSGMDSHTHASLFDAFYSTKQSDKGTGLGLAIVQGIVNRHRGQVVVTSQEGKGSSFAVYFPQILEKTPAPIAERVCFA
jgi:signal transduction histidine kinase